MPNCWSLTFYCYLIISSTLPGSQSQNNIFVLYTNTDDNEATKVNHKFKDIKTTMTVAREGSLTRAPIELVDEVELFKVTLRKE